MFTFFWQYGQMSGIKSFCRLNDAADWADALLIACPELTIIRQA